MTRATHPDSDYQRKVPPAVNDPLRAQKLRTLAALAGRIDLRHTKR